MAHASLVILRASHVTVALRPIALSPLVLTVCSIFREEVVSSATPHVSLAMVVHRPIALRQSVPTACST